MLEESFVPRPFVRLDMSDAAGCGTSDMLEKTIRDQLGCVAGRIGVGC
jgi:hypothetical protein